MPAIYSIVRGPARGAAHLATIARGRSASRAPISSTPLGTYAIDNGRSIADNYSSSRAGATLSAVANRPKARTVGFRVPRSKSLK